jgi:hypothetical protein
MDYLDAYPPFNPAETAWKGFEEAVGLQALSFSLIHHIFIDLRNIGARLLKGEPSQHPPKTSQRQRDNIYIPPRHT